MDGWEDLSDAELTARLRQRGRYDASALVRNREDRVVAKFIGEVLATPYRSEEETG